MSGLGRSCVPHVVTVGETEQLISGPFYIDLLSGLVSSMSQAPHKKMHMNTVRHFESKVVENMLLTRHTKPMVEPNNPSLRPPSKCRHKLSPVTQ